MVGRPDFEVFEEGIHRAVKRLYASYEIGMCLRTTWQEIEQKDEHIRNFEARAEIAERELKQAKAVKNHSAGQINLIVEESVTQRLLNQAIVYRDTACMFTKEGIRTKAYNDGLFDGWKIGIEKTKEKLAEEVCRCENHELKHGWTMVLQAVGIDSVSPLYSEHSKEVIMPHKSG